MCIESLNHIGISQLMDVRVYVSYYMPEMKELEVWWKVFGVVAKVS